MADHRHAGVPIAVRQVTQLAFVARLAALLVAMLTSVGLTLTVQTLVSFLLIGVTSFAGLMHTRWLDVVRAHPAIALVDALVVSSAVLVGGSDSAMVVALLTTSLLLGLWVDRTAGLIVVPVIVLVYLAAATRGQLVGEGLMLKVVVLPFAYILLWLLGLTIRRAVEHEHASQEFVRDAVATAAASQERTFVARELHDSLAKTLQGVTLSATALPVLIERDPARATETATQIRDMSTLAVAQVRQVMTRLRERSTDEPLSEAFEHLVGVWQIRTGREVARRIGMVDTADDSVRYELLMVAEEALDNAHRHAGACDVEVELRREGDEIVLVVADSGRGVSPAQLQAARDAGHLGVAGIHERMARIGGRAAWESTPGHGTRVECRVHREGLIEA